MALLLLAIILSSNLWAQEGREHTAIVCENGNVKTFGYNSACQIGSGSYLPDRHTSPYTISSSNIDNAVSVAIGKSHSLALLEDGSVKAWGSNGSGCSGKPVSGNPLVCVPYTIDLPGCAVAVAAGQSFSMALLADGTIYSWGQNNHGQLGDGVGTTSTHVPVIVDGIANAIAISAGGTHAMALLDDGTVKVWGRGVEGQMGNGTNGGTYITNHTPQSITIPSGMSDVIAIDAGGSHCIVLTDDNKVYSWGSNHNGQLGVGSSNSLEDEPVLSSVFSSATEVDVAAGVNFSFVLRSDGTTRVAGSNDRNQLGLSSPSSAPWPSTPITGPTISNAIDIVVPSTSQHAWAITSTGAVYTWGDNNYGACGFISPYEVVNTPTAISLGCSAIPTEANHPQPCCVAIRADDRTIIGEGATISTTTTYTGQYLALRGTLNITGGMTTFEACDIICEPGSKIFVNGGWLNIDDESHLYACSEMWDGIEVKNVSIIEVKEGAIIEDAITAVDIEYGAAYVISDAIFNKNLTHFIKTMPSSGTPAFTADFRIVRSKFRCHTVGGTHTTLLAPHAGDRTDYAIVGVGVPKLLVGSSSAADANTVENCEYGIFNWTVDRVEVLHNTLEDIGNTGVYAAFGAGNGGETIDISHNTIEKTRYGIFCYDNDTTVRAHITHNVIDFAGMAATPYEKVGITYEEITPATAHNTANFVDISFDTILHAPCGIELINLQGDLFTTDAALFVGNNYIEHTKHSSYGGAAGIKTEQVVQGAFVENEVTHPDGTVNYHESGIRLTGGSANAIICNNTHDVGRGLYFGLRQTPNTDVINNTMKNNQTGLYLAWSVIGHQGSVGNPRDNKWLGTTWNSSNPNTFVESRDGDDSRFYVRDTPSVPSDYIPQFNESGGSGTDLAITQTSGSWPGGCVYTDGASFKTDGAQSGSETLTSLLSVAAVEEIETDRDRSQNYTGLYNIYNRLLADQELISSEPELEAFFAENNNGNMGVLRRAIAGFSAATKGEADVTTLTALQTLQPENLVEQTLKDVFGILYGNATALAEMSQDNEARLRQIAQLCPIDYGFGVYTARAALVTLDTLPGHYIAECEREISPEQMREKREKLDTNRDFSVYPNPSQGLLTVNYELEQGESGEIVVLDLAGRQIHSMSLDAAKTSLDLDLQEMSSGLYLVQIGVNGNVMDSERVSILKP